MRVNKCNIKNIDIDNMDLDFSEYGIYIINGNNGVGKTTILEQIIFGKNEISFNTLEQKRLYNKDRGNLFTYIPQNIVDVDVSVYEYLTKGNKAIKLKNIRYWLDEFKLDNIDLNQKFVTLSGGEKIKFSIIGGILKNNPYIFMDEPTNNLDDESVRILSNIIERLSKNHTFIIVTHDPRFKFINYNKICIEDNKVKRKTYSNCNNKNNKICNQNKVSYIKLIAKLLKKKINILTAVVSLLSILCLLYFMNIQFDKYYAMNESPSQDIIIAYKSDYAFSDLNKGYVESANINIDENNYYKLIQYDDVPKIASMEGVEKIIMLDRSYIDKIIDHHYNNSLLEEFNIISMPDVIQHDYQDIMYWLINNIGVLKKGRLPLDNADEISISENQLKKYYNYDEKMINNALGDTIVFNNKEYKIVGIQYYDLSFISYDRNNNLGFNEYKIETYDEFKKNNIEHKKEGQYDNTIYMDEFLIYTKHNKESTVLDKLIERYPAENYYSYKFNDHWERNNNINFIFIIIAINIAISILLGVILQLISKNQLYMNENQLNDYSNYYIDRRKIRALYFIMMIFKYIFILAIALLVNTLTSKYSFITNYIVILDIIIVLLFIIIYLMKVRKYDHNFN